MKKMYIRKPGFMREDGSMKLYIEIALSIRDQLSRPETTWSESLDLTKRYEEYLEKAAEAGGFFSVKEFLRWMDSEHTK